MWLRESQVAVLSWVVDSSIESASRSRRSAMICLICSSIGVSNGIQCKRLFTFDFNPVRTTDELMIDGKSPNRFDFLKSVPLENITDGCIFGAVHDMTGDLPEAEMTGLLTQICKHRSLYCSS